MNSTTSNITKSAAMAALIIGAATTARAAHGRVEMDSQDELTAAGFTFTDDGLGDGPHVTFDEGHAVVGPGPFAEFGADISASTSSWWQDLKPTRGWWVEATVQSTADDCSLDGGGPGHGLWIHDGGRLVQISLLGEDVAVVYPVELHASVPVSLRNEPHRVRVEGLGDGTARVLVDDVEVIAPFSTVGGGGTQALIFGKLSGCAGQSTWDALEWDSYRYGTGPDDDDDGDGVTNGVDDCAEVADPDQLDSDADGTGDACDPCPGDAENDLDGDGLCGDNDPCPDVAAPPDEFGACLDPAPPSADCGTPDGQPCGIDPIGGGFGGLTYCSHLGAAPAPSTTAPVLSLVLILGALLRGATRRR